MKRIIMTLILLAACAATAPRASAHGHDSFGISFGFSLNDLFCFSDRSIYASYCDPVYVTPVYLGYDSYCPPACTLAHVHHFAPCYPISYSYYPSYRNVVVYDSYSAWPCYTPFYSYGGYLSYRSDNYWGGYPRYYGGYYSSNSYYGGPYYSGGVWGGISYYSGRDWDRWDHRGGNNWNRWDRHDGRDWDRWDNRGNWNDNRGGNWGRGNDRDNHGNWDRNNNGRGDGNGNRGNDSRFRFDSNNRGDRGDRGDRFSRDAATGSGIRDVMNNDRFRFPNSQNNSSNRSMRFADSNGQAGTIQSGRADRFQTQNRPDRPDSISKGTFGGQTGRSMIQTPDGPGRGSAPGRSSAFDGSRFQRNSSAPAFQSAPSSSIFGRSGASAIDRGSDAMRGGGSSRSIGGSSASIGRSMDSIGGSSSSIGRSGASIGSRGGSSGGGSMSGRGGGSFGGRSGGGGGRR